MSTGHHIHLGPISESSRDFDTDPGSDTLPGVDDRTVLETVLELFDDNSESRPLMTHLELPTFAEQSYTDHQIDLVPADRSLVERERALRAAGDWTALAQLLIERAEFAHGEVDAARLLVEAAEIYDVHMGNLQAAQAIALKALEVDPGNMGAASMIEKFAQQGGEWFTLIESFRHAAEALQVEDPARAGELWVRLACAFGVARNDLPRAFSILANVRAGDPSRVRAYLDALEPHVASSKELDIMMAASHRIGDQERSARLLSRAIAMSQSVVERANFHHLIAIIEVNRDEKAAAEWHWQEALRLDPRRQDVREALGALYQEEGEYRKAVTLLDEARAVTLDASARARYAVEAAQIYRDQFGENTRAVDLCAVALAVQPGHHEASLPVMQRYYEQERWAELEPVMDSLLAANNARRQSQQELCELYLIAGECAFELAHFEKARNAYQACLAISPREIEALLGCARASLALSDAADAIANASLAIDLHQLEGHSATRVSKTLYLAAAAHRMLGKTERAIELYQACVENGHAPAMVALAEIYSMQGRHRDSIAMRLLYAEGLSADERVEVFCEISDTHVEELSDVQGAVAACQQALAIDQDSRAALHRLAVLYSKCQEWRAAIKTILKMAALETGAVRRARYLQAAGRLADQDGQKVEAIALLNKAIDSYFADTVMSANDEIRRVCFASFRSIVAMLVEAQDWRALEQNYRRMICRLEPGDPEVGGLWTELGHIYREKLNESDAAIDSFEVACSLDEGRLTNHRILIDLYEGAGSDKLEKAIARRRLLLAAEPGNPEHYKALRGLYVRTRQMDRVFCVCRALDFMDAAEDRERAFYRRNLNANLVWPARPMNSEMRSRFRDPQVNPAVSRIFGLVAEVIAQERALTPGQVQLNEIPDPQYDRLRELFSACSYALGMPTFDCFVQPEQPRPVRLHNLRRGAVLEPTFVLGRGLFAGRSVQHIVNDLAKSLFFGRRSYYLRLLVDEPADLAAAFYAGVTLVRPDLPVPAGVGSRLGAYQAALAKNLHPTWARKLSQAVNAYVLENPGPLNLYAWLDGVDATARHAGLLLCGDLQAAVDALAEEPSMTGDRKSKAVNALLLDSVSESHMSLREDLGLAISGTDS